MKGGNRAAFGWLFFVCFFGFYVSILVATLFVCLLVSFLLCDISSKVVCIYYTQSDFF